MTNEANFAYRQSEALTEDPIGLVVVLYDMMLKDLQDAIGALSRADADSRAAAVRHSMLVLQQLQSTLDMEKGGVVAANLERFYNFTRAKLLEGQIKASSEIFEQQVIFIRSIRDAWEQVRAEQRFASEQPSMPPDIPVMSATAAAESSVANQWSA